MIRVKMESNVDALMKATDEELRKAQYATGHRVGQRFLGFHRARRMRGGEGVKATKDGLRKQFSYKITERDPGDVIVTMGTPSRVARELEEGATITAKSGKLLVPFSKHARARRKTILALAREKKLIRFVAKDNREYLAFSSPSFFTKRGTIRRLQIVAHLRERVKLLPRLKFHETWAEYLPKAIEIAKNGVKYALAAARRRVRGISS
jgi:hypothetical protein